MDEEHAPVEFDREAVDQDPKTAEEFQADEAEFELMDEIILRPCPRCAEPHGLIYCNKCHQRKPGW